MATEIERKFLVFNDHWKNHATQVIPIQQGYFCLTDRVSIRVRITDKTASLNFKSVSIGIQHIEYEYEIPITDAREMLESFCQKPIIEKTRHRLPENGLTWEIDVFEARNAGLIIAEIELDSVNQAIQLPDWIGREVTDDKRYYNPWLCKHPYQQWPHQP